MNDERKFLHDIASPIATAIILADSIIEELSAKIGSDAEAIAQMRQICEQLDKVKSLLQARRDTLIKMGQTE